LKKIYLITFLAFTTVFLNAQNLYIQLVGVEEQVGFAIGERTTITYQNRVMNVRTQTVDTAFAFADVENFSFVRHLRLPNHFDFTVAGGVMTPNFNLAQKTYTVQIPCGVERITFNYFVPAEHRVIINEQERAGVGSFVIEAGAEGSIQHFTLLLNDVIYMFSVLTPFSNRLLHQTFGTTLSVINNPAQTGGHIFTNDGYTWFLNDIPLPQQGGVLHFVQPGNAYSVQVTYTTGETNKICPITISETAIILQVFPNPTQGEIVVHIEESGIVEGENIELFSIGTGRFLRTIPVAGEQTTVCMRHLPTGKYLIRYNHQTVIVIKH